MPAQFTTLERGMVAQNRDLKSQMNAQTAELKVEIGKSGREIGGTKRKNANGILEGQASTLNMRMQTICTRSARSLQFQGCRHCEVILTFFSQSNLSRIIKSSLIVSGSHKKVVCQTT